MQSTIAKSVLD